MESGRDQNQYALRLTVWGNATITLCAVAAWPLAYSLTRKGADA